MSISSAKSVYRNPILGAIIGDIVGSRFEFDNHRSKEFILFHDHCDFTDDTVMTMAVAQALHDSHGSKGYSEKILARNTVERMQDLGGRYPEESYGMRFLNWLDSPSPQPYNSFGNGSAMRVSAVAVAVDSLEEVLQLAETVSAVTHNHPEGIKGAQATAAAICLALQGREKQEISTHIEENYYPLDFTIDEIRPYYLFNETCQGTVPQAIQAFVESEDFEDALRIAVSVGGDSDTLAAITCSIAAAYYGIPEEMREEALSFLDEYLLGSLEEVEGFFFSSRR